MPTRIHSFVIEYLRREGKENRTDRNDEYGEQRFVQFLIGPGICGTQSRCKWPAAFCD
jgi:hypothetical protein